MYEMRQELLENSPVKLLIKLSLPGIIGMLVLGLYSLADAIFVGQMAGSNEVGAVMIAYPFTLINNGIALLVGTGAASILSRAIGKKDNLTVDMIMGNLLLMILVLSAVVTVLGMVFTRELVLLSGAKGDVLDLAVRYLRIIFAGSFFANFAPSANMVIRAEGYMKKAMVIIASGALANVILDPVLIAVFGRGYAVEGAAIATVLSYITYSVVTFFYFTRKSKTVRIHRIQVSWRIVREIIPIGISAALLQLMNLVQQTIIFNMTSQYGDGDQMILIGSALRVITFIAIPLFGMAQGLQPIIGTNYGAGLYDRVKDITNKFLLAAFLLSVCLWLPVLLMPKLVLSVFIKDASIVSEGITYFQQMICIFPAVGVLIIIITFFQALGKGNKAGLLVMLRQVVLFIPTAFLLASLLHMGGIWLSIPVTDGAVLVLGVFLLRKEYNLLTGRPEGISINENQINGGS